VRWNLLFAGLTASWGFIAVLVAAVDLGAETLAFGRLAIAAITLAVVATVWRGLGALRPGGRLPALVLLGILQASHWLLFFVAVKQGSVALAVLTFYTAPVFIAIAAPLLLREPVSNVALGALVPGAVGIGLVCSAGQGVGFSVTAVLAGLGSAVSYAGLVIVAKRLLRARAEPVTVAFWDCLVGAVAVAPLLLAADRVLPSDIGELGTVLLLGIVFTGLSTLVYATLLRRVTAQAAGVLTFLEPVAAVLLAAVLLDEHLSARVIAGGALVLASGLAVVWLEPADVPVTEAAAPVGSQPP
jgi:drug/metabolite transporter (DMT)-like permease